MAANVNLRYVITHKGRNHRLTPDCAGAARFVKIFQSLSKGAHCHVAAPVLGNGDSSLDIVDNMTLAAGIQAAGIQAV